MSTNHRIDHVILSSTWEIELLFGLQMLAGYLSDLQMLDTEGVSFADLGYAEQRAALEPSIIGVAESNRSALSSKNIPYQSIAFLRLSGAMRLENGFSSRGIRQLVDDIYEADQNERIAGILFDVNSGGGQSTAGTELQNALKDVRERGATKTGLYIHQMASAALRGFLPVDYQQAASRSALIGSIGTYTTVNRRLLQAFRENFTEIYAAQSTLKNDEARQLMAGNAEPLIKRLTSLNQVFIDEVMNARPVRGTADDVTRVTSGAIFQADEAQRLGLIDGIGTFRQAVTQLQGLFPVKTSKFYQNSNGMNFQEYLQKLIPAVNQKLGLELDQTMSPEAQLEAIEGAQSVSDAVQAVRDEANTSEQTANERHQALEQRLNALESTNQELAGQVKTLQTAKTTLEGQIADIKGNQGDAGSGADGGGSTDSAPKVEQFATAQNFMGSRTTGKGSKYGKSK